VTCPILIVQALKPWLGGRPYFTRAIVEAQLKAAPGASSTWPAIPTPAR
jgi:hypothetical protein